MNSRRLLWIVFSSILFLGAACKKVIRVDLKNASPEMVIEGNITDLPGPYQVLLSKTVPFSADNIFPPVSGATVKLTDSVAAMSEMLVETAPGVYSSDLLQGIPGRTYNLSVDAGGEHYTASSRMPFAVMLDSVTFTVELDFSNKKVIEAVVNFWDPVGLGNNYQFTETINGKMLDRIFIFTDRLSDGKYISQVLYTDSAYLHVGDTLGLRMYSVDRNIYNYFFALDQVSGNDNFQSATPANPSTNISNGSLGYFSAHTELYREVRVY